jgi:hypothetical protein
MVSAGFVFSFDVMLAAFVLIAAAAGFLVHSGTLVSQMAADHELFLLQKRLFDASESLVGTAGYPADWDPKNVARIGLAEVSENQVKHHVLDSVKIRKVKGMGIGEIKERLLLDGHNVSLTLKTRSGETLISLGKPGGRALVRRFAVCDGEACVLEMSAE